jgi:MinD-like ATPase involved in chromosome partitioning or flagellar assembly
MSQSRPGPGGGIRVIRPSDYDEESSSIKPAEIAVKNQAKKQIQGPNANKQPQVSKPQTPPKPPFDSTLEPWIMAVKPNNKFSFHYVMWWLYTRMRLMRFEFITPPSMTANASAEIHENTKFLNDFRKYLNAIIVVLAAKGGSAKTTIIQWLAAFIGYHVRNSPALLGMDVGADKTASRFDKDENKLFNVTYLLELVKMKIPFTAEWLQDQTETDEESGLNLFKAKPKGSGIRDFNTSETLSMMRYMHQLYPLLFGDTGPGLNMKASDGAAQSADVVLVCNKGISKEALNDIKETLALPNYGLAEKQIKPIVVISGVLPRQMNTRTQYEIVAKECNVDPKNVILLPYDRYLDDQKRFNLKRVHINALSVKTTLMLSRLAKRVLEAIVESEPDKFQSAEDAVQQLISAYRAEQRTQENV